MQMVHPVDGITAASCSARLWQEKSNGWLGAAMMSVSKHQPGYRGVYRPLLKAAVSISTGRVINMSMTRLQGGSLAVFACAADSSDADVSANLNALLGRYGIGVNRDALFSIVQQVLWLQMVQRLLTQGMTCSACCGAAYHAFSSRSAWWLMHG